jgi:segregation and condensation protein A
VAATYEISLEQFTGPLDLLWHLIRTEDLDVLDLDLARITDTYLRFIETHGVARLSDAYHFLAMAASLVELKSRALLPKAPGSDDAEAQDDAEDPRDMLVKQLVAFRSIQEVTGELAQRFEQAGRHWQRQVIERMEAEIVYSMESLSAYDLMAAFSDVLGRPRFQQVSIFREPYDVEEARTWLLGRVDSGPVELTSLLEQQPDTFALIVTFIALLEMIKGEQLGFEKTAGGILIQLPTMESPL